MQPVLFRTENNCFLRSFNGVGAMHGLSLRFCSVFGDNPPSDLFIKLVAPKFYKSVVALRNSHGTP